jgi:hypothetical protein
LKLCFMKRLIRILLILYAVPFVTAGSAVKSEHPVVSEKIMQANSVYIACECPRGMAVARARALQQLQAWGRFQIVESVRQADLVLLFSANKYLGDLLTRDGPDKRPVSIEWTILTVIDANTGEALWTDSRRWGSWRVDSATKDLVGELKDLMAEQVRNWTLNDLMMCGVTPVYKGFGHMTPEEALQSEADIARIGDEKSNRLSLESSSAPEFCKKVELIVGADNRITGFEVSASRVAGLDINEVLQHADLFDFTGGKYSNGDRVYFSAAKKDKKMLIHFDVQGHRSVLSSVTYYY